MENYLLPEGFRLVDKYRINKVLGEGGFGITYLTTDLMLGVDLCIKELYISGSSTRGANMSVLTQNLKGFSFADFKERFLQEARQLARFNHNNIVRVLDFFEANNTAYVVMEYLKGKTLKDLVATKGPLNADESMEIINQLLNAVEVVHNASMLHRDIKPDNLIITDDGRVVLIDFGSARAYSEEKTISQTAMVSPGFAPLEQYNPNSRKGTFTDVYSIGATLYFMLTGIRPMNVTERYLERMKAPHELNPSVNIQVSSAVMLAMEMKPEDRFQNVEEFRQGLQMLVNNDDELNDDEKTIDLDDEEIEKTKLSDIQLKPGSNPDITLPTETTEVKKPKNYKAIVGISLLLLIVLVFTIYSFSNKDTDGDGVADNVDLCPEDSGNVSLDGCPDSDNDGVVNQQDKCPDVSGNSSNGCFYYKSVKFKNRTPIKASLAMAYFHNNKWYSEGWYSIEPNSITEIKLPEGFTNKEIYWSAFSNNLQWSGTDYFCVNNNGRFKNENAKNFNCEQKGFFKLALKGEHTIKELLDR